MILSRDFREFTELLSRHDVRYLVVGGYAVAYHGHPRYTKNLDVWIDASEGNASKLLAALCDFGFGSLGIAKADLMTANQIVQLGYPPNRIDIITSLTGLNFGECYAAREQLVIDGVSVNVIDLVHLKQSKRQAGRHQDLADLESLQ